MDAPPGEVVTAFKPMLSDLNPRKVGGMVTRDRSPRMRLNTVFAWRKIGGAATRDPRLSVVDRGDRKIMGQDFLRRTPVIDESHSWTRSNAGTGSIRLGLWWSGDKNSPVEWRQKPGGVVTRTWWSGDKNLVEPRQEIGGAVTRTGRWSGDKGPVEPRQEIDGVATSRRWSSDKSSVEPQQKPDGAATSMRWSSDKSSVEPQQGSGGAVTIGFAVYRRNSRPLEANLSITTIHDSLRLFMTFYNTFAGQPLLKNSPGTRHGRCVGIRWGKRGPA